MEVVDTMEKILKGKLHGEQKVCSLPRSGELAQTKLKLANDFAKDENLDLHLVLKDIEYSTHVIGNCTTVEEILSM